MNFFLAPNRNSCLIATQISHINKDYAAKRGDMIPTRKEDSIGKWVSRQRQLFKTGNLPKERIELLERIFFQLKTR